MTTTRTSLRVNPCIPLFVLMPTFTLHLLLFRLLWLLVRRGHFSSGSVPRGREDQHPDGGQPRGLVAGDPSLAQSRDLRSHCEEEDGGEQHS